MSNISWHKVSALPATPLANAFYYVMNADFAESYVTNDSGVPKSIGNSAMINAIVTQALTNWTGGASSVTILANWVELQAALPGIEDNSMLLCIDATGDPTVDVGSALYAYDALNEELYKVAEYESMDMTWSWANILGKPTSSVAQIDTAVSQSHSHSNKTILDNFGEHEGKLRYNGNPLTNEWATKNW